MSGSDLHLAVAAAGSGITLADATAPGFPLTYVNAAFERLTGYASEECIGRNCRFLQGPGTEREATAEIAAALREARECTVTLRNFRKDGTPFDNELRLAPVFDDTGVYRHVVGVQNDVTELVSARRGLEVERDRTRRSLESAGRVIASQDQELAELRVLQEALTPHEPPSGRGLSLASVFLPAEEGVAGDFYLVAEAPREATVLAIGDVVGHGLEAARRATYVRAALATFTRFTDDPLRLLQMANYSLIERSGTSEQFVTALIATYRPAEGSLRWAAAGHPGPLALDTGEPMGGSGRPGVPLGIELDLGGEAVEVPFVAGDGILLFTDGLVEARSPSTSGAVASRLGDRRVRELLRELASREPAEVVSALRSAAARHTGGAFADDLCMLAARAAG